MFSSIMYRLIQTVEIAVLCHSYKQMIVFANTKAFVKISGLVQQRFIKKNSTCNGQVGMEKNIFEIFPNGIKILEQSYLAAFNESVPLFPNVISSAINDIPRIGC